MLINDAGIHTASERGARVSGCACLIDQVQRCRFDSRIACFYNPDTAIVGDWWTGLGDTTPCTVNWCKRALKSHQFVAHNCYLRFCFCCR